MSSLEENAGPREPNSVKPCRGGKSVFFQEIQRMRGDLPLTALLQASVKVEQIAREKPDERAARHKRQAVNP